MSKAVWPKMLQARPLFVAAVAGMLCSCGGDQMSNYIQTVKSGLKTLPWPTEVEALFGEGDHFITHYGFSPGPKGWNTEVFFGGRYRLTLQVDVTIDYQKDLVLTNVTAPKFYLFEADSLIWKPDGSLDGANISHQWILDEVQWRKLVNSSGDWSAIGIPVKTNSPILRFDEFIKVSRDPVVRIPHQLPRPRS